MGALMRKIAVAPLLAALLAVAPADAADPRPPAEPVLQTTDVWLDELNMLVFLEKTTAGRVKDTGYLWAAALAPDPRKGSVWMHYVVACKSLTLVWDFAVEIDLGGTPHGTLAYPRGQQFERPVFAYEDAVIEQACGREPMAISQDFTWMEAVKYTMKLGGPPK